MKSRTGNSPAGAAASALEGCRAATWAEAVTLGCDRDITQPWNQGWPWCRARGSMPRSARVATASHRAAVSKGPDNKARANSS